jgi:hypothetical protein
MVFDDGRVGDFIDGSEYLTLEEVIAGARVELKSPQLVGSHGSLRFGALLLLGMMVIAVFSMIFAPWTQNVRGIGKVSAYSPDATAELNRAGRWNYPAVVRS